MPKKTYIYRPGPDGKPLSILTERALILHREQTQTFEERQLATFHQLECEQGSRFNVPGFNKSELKRAWTQPETASA